MLPRLAFPRSEPGRFGEIDPEPVAAALVTPGHFGRDVAELLLDVALVDLGRGGEAGAQRMPGELSFALAFGEIAAYAGGERGAFDQSGNVFVGQALGADALAVGEDPPEQRPLRDPPEFHPRLERDDGAGRVGRAAADLDLPPTGLAAQGQEQSVVEEFDPAASEAVLGAAVEADDFRAP